MATAAETQTPRETNLEIAHKALVNAKYALDALVHDKTLSDQERQTYATHARVAEALIEPLFFDRFA